MTVFAPCKINLVLKILFRRDDGYHELYTIFQKITFGDELTFNFVSEGLSLEVNGESVPTDDTNLCVKAARLYAKEAGLSFGLHIQLKKNVPPGAGLGGGSSDAAAVLSFLNRHFKAFTQERLLILGKKLGADVAFFLVPYSTALARGIGEKLFPWKTHEAWYVILLPRVNISTKWAYENLRLTTCQPPPNYVPDQPLWEQGLVNDFEALVFKHFPGLKLLKERLLEEGAKAALLSGSGAAVFGVFEKRQMAEKALKNIERDDIKKKILARNYIPGGKEERENVS